MHTKPVTSNPFAYGPSPQAAVPATHADEVLVRVEGVSKKFCRSLKKSLWYGLCDIAGELSPFGRRDIAGDRSSEMVDRAQSSISHLPYPNPAAAARDEDLRDGEFYAVRDVSFELRRGECLGLIGHNGAGKTTLLKMLNGLIKPDAGTITMRGRVGALIALGAGFNPILTGRENIYINGSVLGLSKKEIDGKIDEIIDFAEIGDFIDAPVMNYSSGMSVRLGFAIASTLEPDVLLVDEVLAVGDIRFRIKCYNRIVSLLDRAAVILVSHQMFDIAKICSSVVLMRKGKIAFCGATREGISAYESSLSGVGADNQGGYQIIVDERISKFRIERFECSSSESSVAIELQASFNAKDSIRGLKVRLQLFSSSRTPLAEWDSLDYAGSLDIKAGYNSLSLRMDSVPLKSGTYKCALIVSTSDNKRYVINVEDGLTINSETRHYFGAPVRLAGGLCEIKNILQ